MAEIEIAGVKIPRTGKSEFWIPETELVLTPTTCANLEKILYPLRQGYHILLIGDAGAGKNALIYYINHRRQHPVFRYSFNEDTLPEDLIGAYRIDPVTHAFVWQDGLLASSMRLGATFVADEMNLAPPEVLKRFTSVFSEGRLELLEGDGSLIEAAPGFSFVATQNPAEGFEGRKNLPREIQKYFATIFVDSYPQNELLEILTESYSIDKDLLAHLVEINQRVEEQLLTRKIGAADLERYHFNLRNLKRAASRIGSARSSYFNEVQDIYQEPFRSHEDRKIIAEIIKEELIEEEPGEAARTIQVNTASGQIQIGRALLSSSSGSLKQSIESAIQKYPAVMSRPALMESLARSLEMGENILLESEADVEPEEFAAFFAELAGKDLHVITLARGMHTADVLGGLKPITSGPDQGKVDWVDGPLTRAIKLGDYILLRGLEAAGPELVEKLNMLTDDARALVLPPESGLSEPLRLKANARIFGVKFFRLQRSTPGISRAFRNRFSAFVIPPLTESQSLLDIARSRLPGLMDSVAEKMVAFHSMIRAKAARREIGAASLEPYRFGLTNFYRWCEHVLEFANESDHALRRGAGIAYVNEVADARERDRAWQLLSGILAGLSAEELENISDLKKKITIKSRSFKERIEYDQEEHWRQANTGKAKRKLNGQALKKGLDINTPETGGNTKEGADAWYGSDTRGNKGQGEPGAGGGGWGYRTQELYEQFLKKRRPLWEYNIGVSLRDFKEIFGAEIERVVIELDRLFDPHVDISRRYMQQGSRLDVRRYLSYLNGQGDGRIFDKTTVSVEDDKLKGVEVLFAVNKGRRIFNFEYSVATLVAIMSIASILTNHSINFGVCGYSDLANTKRNIDISWMKNFSDPYTIQAEQDLWQGLSSDWHGDTVSEYQLFTELSLSFSADARTRILVFVSDFRGARGKVTIEKDLAAPDIRFLKEAVDTFSRQGVIGLGAGIGPRAIPDAAFHEFLLVGGDNYAGLPSLLAQKLTGLIHRYHSPV